MSGPLPRRDVLRGGIVVGSASIAPVGVASAQESDSTTEHTITIETPGDYAIDYVLMVDGDIQKSTAGGATIDDDDTIDGMTATGTVFESSPDSYTFSGDLVQFGAYPYLAGREGPTVILDGTEIDPYSQLSTHTIVIMGGEAYTLEVESDLQHSTALGSNTGRTVDGNVADTSDPYDIPYAYTFSGDIVRFGSTGSAVYLDGRLVDDFPSLVSTHTAIVEGGYSDYILAVESDLEKSTAAGADIDDDDTVDGTTANGQVIYDKDAYTYSGRLEQFGGTTVDLWLDNTLIDPRNYVSTRTLTLIADQSDPVNYTLRGESDIQQTTAVNSGINADDTVTDNRADGTVQSGKDSYTFTGELEQLAADGDLAVYLDGVLTDPRTVVTTHTATIQHATTEPTAYTLVVESDLQESTAAGAEPNAGDTVSGTRADGTVGQGVDSYTFTGSLEQFGATGAQLRLDGVVVDPWIPDGLRQDEDSRIDRHTLTIEAPTGDPVDYTLVVESDLRESTAAGAKTNTGDTVSGTRADGTVGEGVDSYTFAGTLEQFAATGATVYYDGVEFDPISLQLTRTVTLESKTGDSVNYRIEGGGAEPSTALGAQVNSGDENGVGTVASGRDSWVINSSPWTVERDGELLVYFDGKLRPNRSD